MTKFKGFRTKNAAVKYQEKNGGSLCYGTHRIKSVRRDYRAAVNFGGLDPVEYPYCLQWGGK